MREVNVKEIIRKKRHFRVRKKIVGTETRPRLCVFRSSKHIQAQLIDDEKETTRLMISTLSPDVKGKVNRGSTVAGAAIVGQVIAQKAMGLGIKKVVFDRGGYLYHGRIKALAEAARKEGLEF
jgi:large subunit ribosomal protein L18